MLISLVPHPPFAGVSDSRQRYGAALLRWSAGPALPYASAPSCDRNYLSSLCCCSFHSIRKAVHSKWIKMLPSVTEKRKGSRESREIRKLKEKKQQLKRPAGTFTKKNVENFYQGG